MVTTIFTPGSNGHWILLNVSHFNDVFSVRISLSYFLSLQIKSSSSLVTMSWGVSQKRAKMWCLMMYDRPTSISSKKAYHQTCDLHYRTYLSTESHMILIGHATRPQSILIIGFLMRCLVSRMHKGNPLKRGFVFSCVETHWIYKIYGYMKDFGLLFQAYSCKRWLIVHDIISSVFFLWTKKALLKSKSSL